MPVLGRVLAVSCPLTNGMALIYDGIQLLAETYRHVSFRPMALSCGDDSAWDKGYTLVNYMKSVRQREEGRSERRKLFINDEFGSL